MLCLLHNLVVIYEAQLAEEQGIENNAELKRKAERLTQQTGSVEQADRKMPKISSSFQRLTVRSVKFVRWLRKFLFGQRPLDQIYNALRQVYAAL